MHGVINILAKVLRGGTVLLHEPKTKVDLTKVVETQSFVFDDAFEAHETNETIYDRTIKQLVNFVFDGGKASCFAYGQTGTTYKSKHSSWYIVNAACGGCLI